MEDSIRQLINECSRGNRQAQVALYRMYAKRLYNVCLRFIGNPADAEEAMQDTFLKVFTKISQYHYELSFEAWMKTIAVRTAIDHLRQMQPDWDELPENFALAEEETEDWEAVELSVAAVKEGIKQLATGFRVILSLYLFEGYDMEEISSILHIQPASARSQYLRGKKKLLDIIERKKHGSIEGFHR